MAWPTVTLGAGASTTTPGAGSISWQHIVGSNDTLLEVFVGQGNTSAIDRVTGVTWNGAAMSLKDAQNDANWVTVQIWELINPTPATANIVVSVSNTSQLVGNSISFDGASTTTRAVSKGTTNNATDPTLTVVDSANGDIVISFWGTDDSVPATTALGTSIQDVENFAADTSWNSQYQTATGANTVCGWTHTSGGGGGGALIGVAIKQAAGGGNVLMGQCCT